MFSEPSWKSKLKLMEKLMEKNFQYMNSKSLFHMNLIILEFFKRRKILYLMTAPENITSKIHFLFFTWYSCKKIFPPLNSKFYYHYFFRLTIYIKEQVIKTSLYINLFIKIRTLY